jgi:hypothetical protein
MTPTFEYSFKSHSIQKNLNLFAFLIAFPAINFLGNSLYFYVFLLILYRTYKKTGNGLLKSKFAFILFLSWIFGLLSTILHPPLDFETVSSVALLTSILRYAYWFAIAVYFHSWFRYINLFQLAKWITVGYFMQALGFYILNFKVDLVLFSFDSALSRNDYVFSSILFSGFIFYYVFSIYGRRAFWQVGFFVFFNLLLTDGRAGAVIAVFIILVNYSLLNSSVRHFSKYGIILLFGVSFLSSDIEKTAYSYGELVAPFVEKFSPRFANLLRGVEEGDLDFDKSWLVRELMVDKTLEIVSDYPLLGVGYGNFKNYAADLSELSSSKYVRLTSHTREYYNTRSAHNSYANHLGETGWRGITILVVVLAPVLFWFIRNYWSGSYHHSVGFGMVIIVGFIGGLIHGYAIAAFTGANLWLMLGISSAMIKSRSL